MRAFVHGPEGYRDPVVRSWALRALFAHGCTTPVDLDCIAAALYFGARAVAGFQRDPRRFELVQTPRFTLLASGGDCDDLSQLIAAGLLAVGQRAVFVLGGRVKGRLPSHVLPAAVTRGGQLIPLDLSLEGGGPGRWPPGFKAAFKVEV